MHNNIKIICTNRKARHNYEIIETYEAGMVILGSEVKSLREGRADLSDAYGKFKDGELYLIDMHIAPYPNAAHFNHEPKRPRKLLMHKRELKRLMGKVEQRGMTLIPLKVYFKNGYAKVELALAKGKKVIDRREEIKRREEKRQLQRLKRVYKL